MKRLLVFVFVLMSIGAAADEWEECLADFDASATVYSCGGDLLILDVLNKQGAQYSIVPNETFIELAGGLKIPITPERSYPNLDYLESCPPCENITFYSAPPQGIPDEYSLTAHITAGGQCADIPISGEKIPCEGEMDLPPINATFEPETGKVHVNGSLDTSDPSRIYTLGILHKPSAAVLDFRFGLDVFPFTSRRIFTSEQARDLEIQLFVRNVTEGYHGFNTGNTLSFADVDLDLGIPEVMAPGASSTLSISLENVGTLQDSYSVSLDTPAGWETQTFQTRELTPGDEVEVDMPLKAAGDFKESEKFALRVASSQGRVIEKEFTITAERQLQVEPELVIPSIITVGEEIDYTVKMRAYGTTSSEVQYLVLPDPYTRNDFEDGKASATLGRLNLHNDVGRIVEACGLDYEGTSMVQSAKLALMYSNMASWISKSPEGKISQLRTISERLTELKLVLVDVRMGSKVENVVDRIGRFVDDYEDGRDLTSARENLISNINELEESIPELEEDLFKEGCTQEEEVTLRLLVLPYQDLNLTTSDKLVDLTGSRVIIVQTDETHIRVQSGKERSIIVNLTNGGQTEREFDFRAGGSAASWAYLPREVDLLPGYNELLEVEIEPPTYVAGEYDFSLIVESPPYTAEVPFVLEVGTFEVTLTVTEETTIEPGETQELNVSIKNMGDLTDIYEITVSGPVWGEISEEEVEVGPGNTTKILFTLSPSEDVAEDKYSFTITATSQAYERTYEFGKVTVDVTREAAIVRSRLARSRETLDILVSEYGWNSDLREVENTLDSAEEYLDAGRFSYAKTRIGRAEDDLADLSDTLGQEEGGGGPNYLFVVIVVVFIGGVGYLVWKSISFGKKEEEEETGYYGYEEYEY